MDLLVGQFGRHFPVRDPFREPFGDGRLTDAGFTDETGVVLRTSAEDLDGPVDLLLPADDVVEFPVAGPRSKVGTVETEEPAFLVFALVPVFAVTAGAGLRLRLFGFRGVRDGVHRLRVLERVGHIRVAERAEQRLQRRHRRGSSESKPSMAFTCSVMASMSSAEMPMLSMKCFTGPMFISMAHLMQ